MRNFFLGLARHIVRLFLWLYPHSLDEAGSCGSRSEANLADPLFQPPHIAFHDSYWNLAPMIVNILVLTSLSPVHSSFPSFTSPYSG